VGAYSEIAMLYSDDRKRADYAPEKKEPNVQGKMDFFYEVRIEG